MAMREVLFPILICALLVLSVPALADTQDTQLDTVREEVSSEEITCGTASACDAPSVRGTVEAGGSAASVPAVDKRCLTGETTPEAIVDGACTGDPTVDPGVVRVYVGVDGIEDEERQQASTDHEPQAAQEEAAGEEGLSIEMKAALAAGAVGLGGAGAVAILGMRRFLTVLLAPLAARLQPSELLEDDTRQALYKAIKAEPGINLRGLADKLDLAWGTLLHHLHKLEDAHMVTSERYGKYRRYFLNGSSFSEHEKERLAALSTPSTARVAEYVLDNPGSTQSEIGEALGVSASTILWHARRLKDVDLLETKREGRYVKYFPQLTDQEQAAIA